MEDTINFNGSSEGASYLNMPRQRLKSPLIRPTLNRTVNKLGEIATKTENFFLTPIHLNTELFSDRLKELLPKNHTLTAEEIEQNEDTLKMKEAVNRSHEVIMKARTVWPFTMFRDYIIVDRTKVTIMVKDFFFLDRTISIRLEDILNIKASYGPFFGSITIVVRILNSEDHHSISFLWREDAVKLKNILQGYIIALNNNIACTNQTKDELIETLTELGQENPK